MIAKRNMPTEKRPAFIVAFIARKMSTVSPNFFSDFICCFAGF